MSSSSGLSAYPYFHRTVDDEVLDLPLGKAVCVGRNYAEHAKELNNPVPKSPLLFIKPASAWLPLTEPICLPKGLGPCHYETELVLLIGEKLSHATSAEALSAVSHLGLGLDLTLRALQTELKDKGQPWELAKAFDGALPLSAMLAIDRLIDKPEDWQALDFSLRLNGKLRQQGRSQDMLTPCAGLLAYISQHFTLWPGDLVLTGTPAGVGPLQPGDQLELTLADQYHFAARVASD